MAKPFLGTGLGFPVVADAHGALAPAAFEDSVRQSIWIILATAKGERRMRPDFGCGINNLVFEPNTAGTAGCIAHEVRDALLRFEPRIDVLDVSASSEQGGAALLIDIGYRVRSTNNVFNLVYPFYLNPGGTA